MMGWRAWALLLVRKASQLPDWFSRVHVPLAGGRSSPYWRSLLVINNILTLLKKTGWTGRSRIRNAEDLPGSDKKRNIVTLGGPKANDFTAAILEHTKGKAYKHYDPVF